MSRTCIFSILCFVTCYVGYLAGKENDHRVVVQDARPEFLGVSQDGRYAVARGYESNHTFQVIDLKTKSVVLSVDLPQKIQFAAAAPQNGWFVVAGEKSIFKIDRITARYEVLIAETTGAVAVNGGGDRLAVLGNVDVDDGERKLPWAFYSTSNLGVYDLSQKKWLAKTRTPIVINQLVYFVGDNAAAYGLGGKVHHRRASSFRCDVQLDLATGKAKTTQGLEVHRRGVDDEYTPPQSLAGVNEAREAAKAQLAEVSKNFNPSNARTAISRIFLPLPAQTPTMLVDRRHENGFASGMMKIHRDGRIDFEPVTIDGIQYVRQMNGKLVETWDRNGSGKIYDFATKEPIFHLPATKANSSKTRWYRFFGQGCLFYDETKLSWFQPGVEGPVWKNYLKVPIKNPYPLIASPDGRFLAINNYEGENVYDIYSLKTGKLVAEIPREKGKSSGYRMAVSFNQDGTRLWTTIEQRMKLYEIPSGKLLVEKEIPRDKHHWHITSAGDAWVVGSDTVSSIYHSKTGWGAAIALDRIFAVQRIKCQGEDALLVESTRGIAAVVDLESGEILASWQVGAYLGSSYPRPLPRAFVAFDGRVLVRRVHHASDLELVDLTNLKPIAKIHLVPVDKKMGWVVTTREGHWDATPGAEKYVYAFKGLRRLDESETLALKRPNLLKSQMSHR